MTSGVLWGVLAGVCFGLHQAVFRRVTVKIDALRGALGLLIVAGTFTTILALLVEDLSLLRGVGWFGPTLFAVTGIIHFAGGWTFLGLSQQQIGAARTGVVVAATPLIGSVMAAIFLDESLTLLIAGGVVMVTFGVAIIAGERAPGRESGATRRFPGYALVVAVTWGFTPILIRRGLDEIPAPFVGVSIGMIAAAIAAFVMVRFEVRPSRGGSVRPVWPWILAGGLIVGLAIAAQWQAFDTIEISIAITLMQLSTPVVVFAAPLVAGSVLERPTPTVIFGMLAVVGGSVLVVLGGS